MNAWVWMIAALLTGWSLWTIFPNEARQKRNIMRNVNSPKRSDWSWAVASLILTAVVLLIGIVVLRASR